MAQAAPHICEFDVGFVPRFGARALYFPCLAGHGKGSLALISDFDKARMRGSSNPILRNVWLSTSVESQDYAWRIQLLRETPAHIRFVSFEPLIGPVIEVDLSGVHWAIIGDESGPGARPMEPW